MGGDGAVMAAPDPASAPGVGIRRAALGRATPCYG